MITLDPKPKDGGKRPFSVEASSLMWKPGYFPSAISDTGKGNNTPFTFERFIGGHFSDGILGARYRQLSTNLELVIHNY